jgi:Lon protease-like protein
MEKNPFAPAFENLPETLPVFPLPGVLLLPMGNLPLNIFEKRYLSMVEDAMASPHRLIGMIQPRDESESLYEVGCAGKITEFRETGDGRFLITLNGICRFRIKGELGGETLYRRARIDWSPYAKDLTMPACLDINRDKLNSLLQTYFSLQDMNCDWETIKKTPDSRLMTCLAMVCPFSAKEKQALLEAPCCKTRAETFITMLEMAVKEQRECKSCH